MKEIELIPSFDIPVEDRIHFKEMEEEVIDMKLFPVKDTINGGLTVLKQIGQFIPVDDAWWLAKSEDEVWEELAKFKKK